MIPFSGVHECVNARMHALVWNTVACSLCVPSVCLPISKQTEQVLPQRAAKTQKTANKRWHSFKPSTYSHACAQQNVKPPSQLWSEKNTKTSPLFLQQWTQLRYFNILHDENTKSKPQQQQQLLLMNSIHKFTHWQNTVMEKYLTLGNYMPEKQMSAVPGKLFISTLHR